MTHQVIKPTPGRVVWFHPADGDALWDGHPEPFAAHIARVWNDRMVNLMIITRDGHPVGRTSVHLVQPGDQEPNSSYCTWVPFQVGQAKQQTEGESK